MRVTLNQDEIFEAVGDYLRNRLNLDAAASIEISFTAGRGPKGYSADVDITYPKSEGCTKITAAPMGEGEGEQVFSDTNTTTAAETEATAPTDDATSQATKSAGNLFG